MVSSQYKRAACTKPDKVIIQSCSLIQVDSLCAALNELDSYIHATAAPAADQVLVSLFSRTPGLFEVHKITCDFQVQFSQRKLLRVPLHCISDIRSYIATNVLLHRCTAAAVSRSS
jgi:hypothetical protein